jgi:D-alanyl-D-alanine carboxypeptidase/D-alanyl-D-alanine-endopeptidase (penicillin-binding protein 4)
MITLKKIFVSSAVALSTIVFGQNAVPVFQYPQLYENQISTAYAVSDKSLLSAKEQIDISINSMMCDPVLENANWGFVIYDPKTQKIVNSYNETTPLIPASTTKLLTTETAISFLKSDFKWITQLEYSGQIDENGTLNGNLYLVGSGDITMGTRKAGATSCPEIATDFMMAISKMGIKKIIGDIIVQTAVFKENKAEELPKNIVWIENNNYYLPVGATAGINPQNERLIVKQKNPFSDDEKRYSFVALCVVTS